MVWLENPGPAGFEDERKAHCIKCPDVPFKSIPYMFVTKNPLLFGVRHHAGHVDYSADSFIEMNVSELPAECFDLMATPPSM